MKFAVAVWEMKRERENDKVKKKTKDCSVNAR